MQKKKKVWIVARLVLIVIIVITIYKACTYNPDSYEKSYEAENRETVTEIIRCFDEKDVDGLENMFAKEEQDGYLRRQIQSAYEIYDSKSVASDGYIDHGMLKNIKTHGKYTYKEVAADMSCVRLENGREFNIGFVRCVIDKEKPDEEGITRIFLTDSQYGNMAMLGVTYGSALDNAKENAADYKRANNIGEYRTSSIIIKSSAPDSINLKLNEYENISHVEELLKQMNMTQYDGNDYGFVKFDYEFTLMDLKSRVKAVYTFKNEKCMVMDDKKKLVFYIIDDTDTYNELIEFSKSLFE